MYVGYGSVLELGTGNSAVTKRKESNCISDKVPEFKRLVSTYPG
jgi:hypothetical protein